MGTVRKTEVSSVSGINVLPFILFMYPPDHTIDSPYPIFSDRWKAGEYCSTQKRDGVEQGQHREPAPLEEEDFVVDYVQAEHAHGVVNIEVPS